MEPVVCHFEGPVAIEELRIAMETCILPLGSVFTIPITEVTTVLSANLTGTVDALGAFLSVNPRIVLVRLEVHAGHESEAERVKAYLLEKGIAGDRLEMVFIQTSDAPYVDAEIVKVE